MLPPPWETSVHELAAAEGTPGGIADATERANLIAYVRTRAGEPVPVGHVTR